jgi:hypothetical protein
MPAFAREQHIDYLLFTAADFHRDLPDAERTEVRRILATDPELKPIYDSSLNSVIEMSSRRAIPDTPRVEIRTPGSVKTAARHFTPSTN